MSKDNNAIVPRPMHWPHRADPPTRYWNNYDLYQRRGGMVRLEDDIRSLIADKPAYPDISRFYFFCLAFDQLTKEGIRGDVAELGAYKGHTAGVLANMARRLDSTAWVFDTFEGFNAADLNGVDESRRAEFADTSLEAVRALVGDENVQFVKGYFPDSTSQVPDDLKFCFVHIDCDLYQPISQALKYFYPRLLPGGYLIVHDYASLAWDGAERAVDEFFADKPEPVIPLTDGGGSVVIRKARKPGADANWLMQKKSKLLTDQWTSAARGALLDLLGTGWSGPEDWGVWGVGPSHILDLVVSNPQTEKLIIELDCAAALFDLRPEQSVDIVLAGQRLTTWHFSLQENRGHRTVEIPISMTRVTTSALYGFQLEFQPRLAKPISEIDISRTESRALGLALYAIRQLRT